MEMEDRYIIHERKITVPNLWSEMTKYMKINPYFEYEKHPIFEKEIRSGLALISRRNPDLPMELVMHRADVGDNESKLEFYLVG